MGKTQNLFSIYIQSFYVDLTAPYTTINIILIMSNLLLSNLYYIDLIPYYRPISHITQIMKLIIS